MARTRAGHQGDQEGFHFQLGAAQHRRTRLNRYIGYWKPYATSHDKLDADDAIQEEVRNAARALVEGVSAKRSGRLVAAGNDPRQARKK